MRPSVFAVVLASVISMTTHGSNLQSFHTPRIKIVSSSSSQELYLNPEEKISLNTLAKVASAGPLTGFRFDGGKVLKSPKGIKRVRLIQTFAGYDVFGSSVEAELDSNDNFSGHMYGMIAHNLYKDIPNPEDCKQSVPDLLDEAIKLQRLLPNDQHIDKKDGRRLIFTMPEVEKPRLAYKIDFMYANRGDMRYPVYFFDACKGDVLMAYDQLASYAAHGIHQELNNVHKSSVFEPQTNKSTTEDKCTVSCEGEGGNEKIGKVTYNTSPYCLNVKEESSTCIYDGRYTRLVDNEGSTSESKTTAASALCEVGYKDAVNGAYGVASDAFFHGELFGEYFEAEYNTKILDFQPRVVVHYDTSLENAFADGTDTYFGDGASNFYPLVSLDVVAHELGHLITARNSRLVYSGMSGGMNEAFSDMTGAAVAAKLKGTVDWLIGSDIAKVGKALRYMDDPPEDGSSIKHVDDYRPNLNVHYSSGIFNYAFYRLVDVEKMNLVDAYTCFLYANVNLWGPTTDFFDGACNVMQAAYDNGFDYEAVQRAFEPTGIPLNVCDFAALTTSTFAGETRDGILVRATRSPIIKIDPDHTRSNFTVKVTTEDKSQIQVVVGEDNKVIDVITKGTNIVKVENLSSPVYVKLVSDARKDVSIKIAVL